MGEFKGHFRERVTDLLIEGFGTEDIAVKTGESLQDVRTVVEDMRADGSIKSMAERRWHTFKEAWS